MSMDRVEDRIKLSQDWLLDSGIQNFDQDSEIYGSFQAWYDLKNKRYSYAYSEITGLALTTLSYLNHKNQNEKFIKNAEMAAKWLLNHALDNKYGGFRCRYVEEKFYPWLCSFDNGMILNGFINLYRETKKSKYLDISINLGNWLINFISKEDGTFYAKYHTEEKAYIDTQERWSTQSGSFLAKNAIGLINLTELTREEKYAEHGRKICDLALKRQQSDGRFITNQRLKDTYMHPHCYSIEGIFYAGLTLNEERYLEKAVKAAKWTLKAQLNNGGISRIYNGKSFLSDESVDSIAQAIRLWLIISEFGDLDYPYDNLVKAVNRLCDFQCESNDLTANGGFFYGYTNKRLVPHVSAHATMFALQALDLWHQKISGNLNFDMRWLI